MTQHLRWKKKLTATFLSLFALALVLTGIGQGRSLIPSAEAATLVVSPGSLQDWAFQMSLTASGQLVNGPGTPPLGTGSLHLSVGSDGNSGAQFRNDGYDNTPLEDVTVLRYSTYVSANAGCQAPYLVLNIDTDNNGTVDDLLFFEPCYQNGTYTGSIVPDQGDVMLDTWQEWNALTGGWWTSSGGAGGPPLTTIAAYVLAHPDARIMNGSGGEGGVRIVAGFGAGAWDNFLGNADALTIGGTDGREDTYDFEAMGQAVSSASSISSSTGSSISSSVSSSLSSVVCDIYADAVTAFDQGDEKGGGAVALNRSDTSKALGHPTAGSPPRFVSLGFSGSITIRFDNYIVNGTGADLRVYESTNAVNYPLDRAQVWARQTATGAWTLLGTADSSDNVNGDLNTSDLDLGPLHWARYIRIIDTTNPAIHATGADAFDLNALEALNNSCVQPGLDSSSSSSSSMSSSTGSSISSSISSSSSSIVSGQVPLCDGMPATVYVDEDGMIVGGRDDGEEYEGVLRGSNGSDVMAGTADDDRIHGGIGDDTICGGGGDDELDGGSGDDKLGGESGDDELDGSNGQDLLCGHEDDDELDASNDSDELDGGEGDDELDGGNGQDVCRNGEDNEDCESSGGDGLAACAVLVSTHTSTGSSL